MPESDTSNNGDAEYYAFGNPQPTFDSTTHALTNLAVQVVGAAQHHVDANGYLFDTETINLASTNGFLTHVWWSNYESYSQNGDYSSCSYNWARQLQRRQQATRGCNPGLLRVPTTTCSGRPTPTTRSSSAATGPSGSPSFGNPSPPHRCRPPVETADPRTACSSTTNNGQSGSGGAGQNYDGPAPAPPAESASTTQHQQLVRQPGGDPAPSDAQLGTIAGQNGCLYSGPTQITLRHQRIRPWPDDRHQP